MALRVLVADDELQARKRLVRLLEGLEDLEIVCVCASGDEVLERVAIARPDVLVLDISMPASVGPQPERTGLALRAALPPTLPVIFVTAHREHAIEAFDLGATDYVLKPVTAARLGQAIDRARERLAQSLSPPATRIPIETRDGVVLVDPNTVIHASFDGALVSVVTPAGTWLTTSTLRELEARLPPKFVRTDRRHLLNLDEVERLEPEPDGGSIAVTRGAHRVPVSRQATRELRRRLGF
ncbi:MAG: response regulator [Polyangiaceae bacterium]